VKKIKFILIKSFLFSIFIHLIIFNIFTFTFSIQTPQKKPELIFLGSILHSFDLYHNITDPNRNLGVKKGDLINNVDVIEINIEKPFHETQVYGEKPVLIKINNQRQKQTQKVTFLNEAESSKPSSTKDIGVDLKLKPYQPLELKSE